MKNVWSLKKILSNTKVNVILICALLLAISAAVVSRVIIDRAMPVISLRNVGNGIKVSYSLVGFDSQREYILQRRMTNTGWEDYRVLSFDKTSITDSAVKRSFKYYYRIVRSNGAKCSKINSIVRKYTFSTPKLTDIQNIPEGIQIAWEASQWAQRYRIYRKTGEDDWRVIGDTTEKVYTDESVNPGTLYTYSVRCVTKDGEYNTSFRSKTGITIMR